MAIGFGAEATGDALCVQEKTRMAQPKSIAALVSAMLMPASGSVISVLPLYKVLFLIKPLLADGITQI